MRKLLLFLLTCGATPLLHAQLVELYGTVTGGHANNVPTVDASACFADSNSIACQAMIGETQVVAGGGVTLNFLRLRPGPARHGRVRCAFLPALRLRWSR